MILTTAQQARNFVLYALDNDPLLDINVFGGDPTELARDVTPLVTLVFGTQTFSDKELSELVLEAVEAWLNRDY